jgi:hypothetical protein
MPECVDKVPQRGGSQGWSRLGQDNKGRHVIYKTLGGVVLALVVLVLVALEVRTTVPMNARSTLPWTRYGECGPIRIR